jgi:hypothetical protein
MRQGDIMAAPNTRNWSAHENAHKPKGLHLLVRGEVEVSALNKLPQLAQTDSRDPKVLGLNLTIVDDPDEPSGDQVVWRCANYHEVVTADQYNSVVIRWDGSVIERITVVNDREHGAAMKKQAQAQNAAAAKTITVKPAKPAPKKPAPKKAATKAAAKKATVAAGGAKKAKKKTAKKAAKKSAKKTVRKSAKKSTLKKLVKKLVKKLTPKKKKKR